MWNKTLWMRSLKSNYIMILIFMAVLTMYFTIIANMYDPNSLDIVEMLAQMKLSPELLNALGFTLTDTSLTGFLSSYFYGMLMVAFPMVFYVILANKLIAQQVDRGSMAYVLSTPNTRFKVVFTQLTFLLFSLFVLVGYVTVLGIVFCEAQFSGLLDIKAFILMNLGVFLLHIATASISFLSSCFFNESKHSLLFGSGIPIMFLLLRMLANASPDVEILKYFTMNTLFNAGNIIQGVDFIPSFIAMGAIVIVLYSLACTIFTKKDLPI